MIITFAGVSCMKRQIGERAGMGIPEFMKTWQTYVENEPSYVITHNPDRTKLVVPYAQSMLQKAGEKLSDIIGQSTLESTQSTSESTQSTSEFVLSSTAKEILLTIEQNPQITYDEIADKMGKARSGIARHIKNLQKKGLLIAKAESGEWTVVKSPICQK